MACVDTGACAGGVARPFWHRSGSVSMRDLRAAGQRTVVTLLCGAAHPQEALAAAAPSSGAAAARAPAHGTACEPTQRGVAEQRAQGLGHKQGLHPVARLGRDASDEGCAPESAAGRAGDALAGLPYQACRAEGGEPDSAARADARKPDEAVQAKGAEPDQAVRAEAAAGTGGAAPVAAAGRRAHRPIRGFLLSVLEQFPKL